ncbi:MAG: ribose-phosphate pyrophosphokinase [Ruminococcaceae bacterium]|jgi:ribose-phosphate pyrophosphokinase|nr:ribose-phosphate pyrophosphokinase [Oscillospiraceae bacterium]
MVSHERTIKVFTGNANRPLAEAICKAIGIKLGDNEVKSFADGEVSCSFNESVRGSDVFLVQSTCKPVNQNLMELLIMIDACRRASAGRITAVIPYFGYARQDRKTKSRDPISAKLVANMISAAGADRVVTMDLHASQIQGFFDIPADNLLSYPVFAEYYAKKFGDALHDMVVVSPDVGPIARARKFAETLASGLAIVDRREDDPDEAQPLRVIGDVQGKDCILFADIVDTANTVVTAAKALAEVGGARNIYACASHGVLSEDAIERLAASNIKELALLDTIPAHPEAERAKLKYLTVAPLFGETIERIYKEISITKFSF